MAVCINHLLLILQICSDNPLICPETAAAPSQALKSCERRFLTREASIGKS